MLPHDGKGPPWVLESFNFWLHLPLTLSLPEYFQVIALLAESIKSSSVASFRPPCSAFFLMQNLQDPEKITSSPAASMDLMISRRVSVIYLDRF